MKLSQLIEYYRNKFLRKKYAENVHQKPIPDHYSKISKIFWKRINEKTKKKVYFFNESSLFLRKLLWKKASGTCYQFLFRFPNMFRIFLCLMIHCLAIFGALFQRYFWVISKLTIGSLSKPSHFIFKFFFKF